MDSISDEYLNMILKSCFPQVSNIQIVECKKLENLENVSSDIFRLIVELLEGVETHTKKLILKIPYPDTTLIRAYCTELKLYQKEKQMFEIMIPYLRKMQISKRLPVHYLTIDEGTIVMEDLAAQGYTVAGKSKLFDLDESDHIFKAMAEFHVATYKVHHENPHLLRDPIFDRTIAIDVRQDFSKTWEPVICELFRRKNVAHRIPKFNTAMDLLRREDQAVYAMMKPAHFKLVLLNHGDLRIDNMMLKLNENGQIQDVKFIDFQMCWWSSPVYDFLYYLAFSVPIELIDKQFDDLVDGYWQHFNQAQHQLECYVDYEKADFLSDIEKTQFMFAIWLTARCSFTCPLEQETVRAIFKRDDKEAIQLCCQCLDDEQFSQSLWGWLQYCEKIKLFDIMADEVTKTEYQ